MIVDKVNEIFRNYPDNYIQKLEEDKATPQNDRQEYLVAYFDGGHELSEKTLHVGEPLVLTVMILLPKRTFGGKMAGLGNSQGSL